MAGNKLGGILTGEAAAAVARNKAAQEAAADRKLTEIANARRGETVDVSGLGRIRFEPVGARAYQEIERDTHKVMTERGLALDYTTSTTYELERAVRTLAIVARDPDDHARPFGSLEEWERVDPDRILLAWSSYGDVRERLDPAADGLTAAEAIEIEIAVKKKELRVLRSFGLRKLSAWLCTTGVQLSTSPPPTSSSGESPSG